MNKYLERNEENKVRFNGVPHNIVRRYTTSMTSICMLMRPVCGNCPFRGDEEYCPPSAATAELNRRGIL